MVCFHAKTSESLLKPKLVYKVQLGSHLFVSVEFASIVLELQFTKNNQYRTCFLVIRNKTK